VDIKPFPWKNLALFMNGMEQEATDVYGRSQSVIRPGMGAVGRLKDAEVHLCRMKWIVRFLRNPKLLAEAERQAGMKINLDF